MYFFELWFSYTIYPVVGLLGYMVVLFLDFKEIFIPFSIMAVSIYISTNCARGFPFLLSIFSPAFIVCRFFDDGHSDRYEVIPHCSFDLHFSNNDAPYS